MIFDEKLYPYLSKYGNEVKKPNREMVGREKEMRAIKAVLNRAELCNVMLLGEAGVGKSSIVQKCMVDDSKRFYFEVDLAKVGAGNLNDMPSKIKGIFDDVEKFQKDHEGREIVLFMDEFHLLPNLSLPAVEAIKPKLADSGTRGVKVIGATTYVEFNDYLKDNQPLVERFYRLNLSQMGEKDTIRVLKGMSKTYGVEDQFYNDRLFKRIYELTNRYVPANAQPRKSLLMLDAMMGYHKAFGFSLDDKLLADVIYESEGVNISFRVDATTIQKRLDEKVFAQELATEMIARRLQVAVADLNDATRPLSTLLFTGSTGVGKSQMIKELAGILFEDKRKLLRFDMSEFSLPESLERFRDELTSRIWQNPFSIVMLDEIEKSCSEVTRLLLQVLDDARLTDRNNREVSFKNCYVIMTTNAGNEIYKAISAYMEDERKSLNGKRQSANKNMFSNYRKLIRTSLIGNGDDGGAKFPPELYNRIDEVIPFAPLSDETLEKIIKVKLKDIFIDVKTKHNIEVEFDPKIIAYLLKEDADVGTDAGGARGIVRKINSDILSEVARVINMNGKNGRKFKKIRVVVEGEMMSENKYKRISDAYINVFVVK